MTPHDIIIPTLQITGWFAFIIAKVYYDHKHWGRINHVAGLILMITIGIMYEWIVFNTLSNGWIYFQDVTIFMVTSYWIFMEGLLHVSVGENWFYQGNTARLDRWFKKNMGVYIGLKFFAAAMFIYSVIQIYKY